MMRAAEQLRIMSEALPPQQARAVAVCDAWCNRAGSRTAQIASFGPWSAVTGAGRAMYRYYWCVPTTKA